MQRNASVIVGLSGGVDSSVSALLLKEQGFDVQGLFMKNWEEDDTSQYCSAEQDLNDVKAVCKTLKIPLHTVNFAQEYWQSVFSLFLDEYRQGRTPNPDILCNKEIKFKAFLAHAQKLGAEFIAMGHYVQRDVDETKSYRLLKGHDQNKDQSYFLYTLGQAQLAHSLFPVGHLDKPIVRQLAQEANLITHNKKDSTGICFIGKREFKTFLQDFMLSQAGEIKTPEGVTVGKHDGLMYYTLGQRQGLKIGGIKGSLTLPWYVIGKNLAQNILYVTQEPSHPWHFSSKLTAIQMHWVKGTPPAPSFEALIKVRYRQESQPARVKVIDTQTTIIEFLHPQKAVTPGQSAVIYQDNICLGGGIIAVTDSVGGLLSNTTDNKVNLKEEYHEPGTRTDCIIAP